MTNELALLAESWSEGTIESQEKAKTEDLSPVREKSRSNNRGLRKCAVLGRPLTFNGAAPKVRHVWDCYWPAEVDEPRNLVQVFFREVARLLQLPHKGKEDEAALDELRSLVQRSVRPVLLGFAGKWFDSANALAEHVGLVPCSL